MEKNTINQLPDLNFEPEPDLPDLDFEDTSAQKIYKTVKHYLEPTTEALGLVGGGIVGTGVGTPGVGTVVGGSLGYAGVKQAWEAADVAMGVKKPQNVKDSVISGLKKVREGGEVMLTGEVLGVAGGKALQWTKNKIQPKRLAGKILKTSANNSERVLQNIEASKKIESLIPGVKFTRGQITNDAQAIALERAIIRSETKTPTGVGKFEISAKDLNQEQRAFMEKSLQDYYTKKLLKGKVKDFTNIISREEKDIITNAQRSEELINKEVNRLSNAIENQEVGSILHKRIKAIRDNIKKTEVDPLWENIPNRKIVPGDLSQRLQKMLKDFDPLVEETKNFPAKRIKNFIQKLKKPIDIDTLIKMRKTTSDGAYKASHGIEPNLPLERAYNKITAEIDVVMKDLGGESGKAYNKAREAMVKFGDRFRKGETAEILSKGSRGEETKIAFANIAKKYFTKDGINNFINAVGNDKIATDAMKEYAKFDLYTKAINKETNMIDSKKAVTWLNNNSHILNKLGIKQDFSNIVKKVSTFKISQAKLDLFNKSVAAKFLNAAPEVAIKTAFSGSKNYAKTAKELLSATKGDANATKGLQKAMSDYIFEASLGSEGFYVANKINHKILDKTIKQFMPALKVLYKNDKKQLTSLLKVNRAYQIASRNLQSIPLSGEEASNFIKTMMAPAIGLVSGAKGYWTSRAATGFISKYSAKKVNQYLLKATFDPDYADALINMVRASKPGVSKEVKTRTSEKILELMGLLSKKIINKEQ